VSGWLRFKQIPKKKKKSRTELLAKVIIELCNGRRLASNLEGLCEIVHPELVDGLLLVSALGGGGAHAGLLVDLCKLHEPDERADDVAEVVRRDASKVAFGQGEGVPQAAKHTQHALRRVGVCAQPEVWRPDPGIDELHHPKEVRLRRRHYRP